LGRGVLPLRQNWFTLDFFLLLETEILLSEKYEFVFLEQEGEDKVFIHSTLKAGIELGRMLETVSD
jgi:hypothetical protein